MWCQHSSFEGTTCMCILAVRILPPVLLAWSNLARTKGGGLFSAGMSPERSLCRNIAMRPTGVDIYGRGALASAFRSLHEYIGRDMNVQKARSLSASRPWPLPAAGSTIIACLPRDMSSSGLAPVVYEVTRNPSPFSLCIGHMTSKGSARRAPARALHS